MNQLVQNTSPISIGDINRTGMPHKKSEGLANPEQQVHIKVPEQMREAQLENGKNKQKSPKLEGCGTTTVHTSVEAKNAPKGVDSATQQSNMLTLSQHDKTPEASKVKTDKDTQKTQNQTEGEEDGQITAHNTSNLGNSIPPNSHKGSTGVSSINSLHSGSAGEENAQTKGSQQITIEEIKETGTNGQTTYTHSKPKPTNQPEAVQKQQQADMQPPSDCLTQPKAQLTSKDAHPTAETSRPSKPVEPVRQG